MDTTATASRSNGQVGQDSSDCAGYIVDFHSHILPEMDDGSKSLDESLAMIEESVRQQVCCILLTPHFYPTNEDPEKFLNRRLKSSRMLRDAMNSKYPLLAEGAEIQYFEGITTMQELPLFRIGNSKLLLIEMPFMRWTERMIEDILEINYRDGYQVVIAHIERYLREQKKETLDLLRDCHVMIQSNASFFTGKFTRRRALKMLEDGYIDFIGSDCHNSTTRAQCIGDAAAVIEDNYGSDDVIRRMSVRALNHIYRK